MTCPKGYLMKDPMPEHSTCAGAACEAPTDTDACCEPLAECSTMTCPKGYLMKDPMPEHSTCAGAACEAPTDTETCCVPLGPTGYSTWTTHVSSRTWWLVLVGLVI